VKKKPKQVEYVLVKGPLKTLKTSKLVLNSPVLRTAILPSPDLLDPLTPLRSYLTPPYSVTKTPDSSQSEFVSSTPLFFDNQMDTDPSAFLNIYYNNSFIDESAVLSETQKIMEKQDKDKLVQKIV